MSGSAASSNGEGGAAERAAESVLRAAGGRSVLLRMPAKASASDAEQLGLATPLFQDVPLGPAAFRKVGSTKTLLVSARSVRTTLSTVGAASVEALFLGAVGVVIGGELYRIERAVALRGVGQPYCWAITLIAPVN